jgi:pimeloyl-ACP methyl ester carboxylesterase
MSLRRRLLRLLLILTLTPVIFLLSCQSKLMYFPRSYSSAALNELAGRKGQPLAYQTGQGTQKAYYVPPRTGTGANAPLWLCFAGNGSLALDWLDLLEGWDDRFAYLLVDYPSYGECAGKPTPANIRENAAAAFTTLAQHLKTDEASLAARSQVLGHSLGAAAGLLAAEKLGLKRAVLIAPFTTMTDMARKIIGWPLCHLNCHRFDNRATLKAVSAREGALVIILHGTEDEVIPVAMGRELAEAHPSSARFHELPGIHHNDILFRRAGEIGAAMREVTTH